MNQNENTTPRLRGSRCDDCATVAFPASVTCQRCGSSDISAIDLSTVGTVWTATIQRFPPKSPPYVPPAEGFVPFAVGYVELPEGVKVEALLDGTSPAELIGREVELVEAHPVPRFASAATTTEEN
ncbi:MULTISPECIES: Zn-ribbon domain-containing OB-fold protein [Dietzia]|uniref:Zn-ribbon domain-containing OB-fold protein n=1 Tax=Dietzia TaxID=37914 RepID=UPI0022B51648|nr:MULTISPECIES: OB-fold domain-containing protein [Dietzia]MCZ4538576.1 OB-fold domain-containing protein [Dietzia maris]MDV3355068.1 OB-fold domain-containing protein [Dietzia sp. IN118]